MSLNLAPNKIAQELRSAVQTGDLPRVQLLVTNGASVAKKKGHLSSLMYAARLGHISIIEWLLTVGLATISQLSAGGDTVLLLVAAGGCDSPLQTVQWLLEHGGADIADVTKNGQTVWDLLKTYLIKSDTADIEHKPAVVTALLKVMVLRDAPPVEITARLSPEHKIVVQEGARLRASLVEYLTRRRALLGTYCPLIAPLRDLVHGYEEPTTTEELWATGLGAAPRHAKRTHSHVGANPFLRRSERLRRRREE